jgi:hypothetical protein
MALLVCLAALQATTASADPTYGVMNASGGIYWRSAPDWNTPVQTAGFGFYPDTVIAVHCYQAGAGNVPGSADYMWEYATDVGGSGFGTGWINEHFINDGQPINQPSPGVPPCGGTPEAPPAANPIPAPGLSSGAVYSILDADGGVYFRRSLSWADAEATPGHGIYTGDQVEVICGAFGEAYGPYANRWWSYVRNLTRPGAGSGWVNAHFINDGMPANHPSPGEGTCESRGLPTPVAIVKPAGSAARSAFFWPKVKPYLPVSEMEIEPSAWYAEKGCSPLPPAPLSIPASVNTLAGWSLGRLGPMYFLHNYPNSWGQIHTIILFDPGSYSEMTGGPNEGCDSKLSKPSINEMLAKWLRTPGNELLVLAGIFSEEKPYRIPGTEVTWGNPRYTGLWNFYFHDLWGEPPSVRSRAVVCDYDNLAHAKVLEDLYPVVKASALGFPPEGCPVSPSAPTPTRWSP